MSGEVPMAETPASSDDTSSAWYELSLSSFGVLAVAVKIPFSSLLLPLCVLGSSVSMITRAYAALTKKGRLTVDVLDASAAALLGVQGELKMAMFMIWLINIGDYIRDATMDHAYGTVEAVLAYQTSKSWVIRGRRKVHIDVGQIRTGDKIIVYAGDRITVDGQVVSGSALVDQRALTGEPMPVEKTSGSEVFASTVVHDGTLIIRATHIGSETEAAKIVRLVQEAPVHETMVQNYAERWANDLVPFSFMAALVKGLFNGVSNAASVLVIDYGTGIRVAAPTAVLATMSTAIHHGILFKGGRALEALAGVDVVIFDKTGTLSLGAPQVVAVRPYGMRNIKEVLAFAAAAEEQLNHPVARAIVQAAIQARVEIPNQESARYLAGQGVLARVRGSDVHVGSARYLQGMGIGFSDRALADCEDFSERAISTVCIAVDHKLVGIIGYADQIRPEARAVLNDLRQVGMKDIVMLTGDQEPVARHVAGLLGISRFEANLLPGQKMAYIKDLQRRGLRVAVVGDGINDSPALAHADVGIAMTGGADVARESAHVVLINGDLRSIPFAITLARRALAQIQDCWNVILIPNTIALALSVVGQLGPGTATLLSNGAAVVATGFALRPLWERDADGSGTKAT
jgi:Cu2+-exporting ATPase